MRNPHPNPKCPRSPGKLALRVEQLEDRSVPATFTVSTLADAGAGSIRQAILDANASRTDDTDTITFSVAGTIQLTSGPLPDITDPVNIDGTTAPGFAGTPVVEVDYNGFTGLHYIAGGSELRSLALVGAGGSGVVIENYFNVIAGNFIGVELDGTTADGNAGDGIELRWGSIENTIGGTGAHDANVISGNGGNGISITGASVDNRVVGNLIGTDATGTADLGNARNGVSISKGAVLNTIGGTTPDATQYAGLPPEGNVISGNGGNGVRLGFQSQLTTLAGNFIGTDITGTAAVGNAADGVAIVNSDNNTLVGTFRNLQPFVFYNVIGGNGGNGLRIDNSDNTIVHANFFGLGSDNRTPVGNTLDGVVVEGDSANTTFGGVIPLGNAVAANGQNGVVVQDTASDFLAFNTFAGVAAFQQFTNLGNVQDGFLITSTGSGILLRVNIVSSNGANGVEIAGSAGGVQVVQNFIGTDTAGNLAMPNGGNGVQIGGNAHDNVIGGVQTDFSVTPRNVISANTGHGIAVLDSAHDNRINFSYIGTDLSGRAALPNGGDGIFLDAGTTGTRIGSRDPNLFTLVSGNTGHGIEIAGSSGNSVIGTWIGPDATGALPLPNGGSGVFIDGGTSNVIGSTKTGGGNDIAFNLGSGVSALSGNRNTIRGNSIHSNAVLGIELGPTGNTGVTPPEHTAAGPFLNNNIRVVGVVKGRPGSAVTVDVYANFDDEPLDKTEGWFYLGSVGVVINPKGRAVFRFEAYNPPPGVQVFTATATNAAGSTSEFSPGNQSVGP